MMKQSMSSHLEIKSSYKTACDRTIIITSRALDHLQAHPDVIKILPEALVKATLPSAEFVEMEIDLDRIIGLQTRVKTMPCDIKTPINFALRKGRDKPSRVAPPGTVAPPARSVVVIAKMNRDDPATYNLVTAWIGTLARKEPWDPMIKSETDYQESLNFWCSNALIHDPDVMGEIFASTWDEVLDGCRFKTVT